MATTDVDKTLVEVDLWRCCSLNGEYLGDSLVHDPDEPGDGPWMLTVTKQGVTITFGFGTKEEGLATVNALTHHYDEEFEIEIDPTED